MSVSRAMRNCSGPEVPFGEVFMTRSSVGRPEVRLWTVTPSGIFESEVVVHRVVEFLLAAEITFSCLNRSVPKEKLNLLKFTAGQMA